VVKGPMGWAGVYYDACGREAVGKLRFDPHWQVFAVCAKHAKEYAAKGKLLVLGDED